MDILMVSVFSAFVGACLGSFCTMLVWRLHYEQKGIFCGRSRCTNCGKNLRAWNLIPIVSWVIQQGKCAFCGARISPFYPLTELSFALSFFFFVQKFYSYEHILILLALIFFVLVLFWYDILFLEVDRRISFPAIALAFIWAFFREVPLESLLLGGGIGFLFYAVQYFCSKGRWVGMGDMELGLLMGVLLGWKYFLMALFLSYILGLVIAIPLLLFGKANRKSHLPMGAFLMPVLLVFLYDGQQVWEFFTLFFHV